MFRRKKEKDFIKCYLCGFKSCKDCFIKNVKINKSILCINCKRQINKEIFYNYLNLNELNEIKEYYYNNIINMLFFIDINLNKNLILTDNIELYNLIIYYKNNTKSIINILNNLNTLLNKIYFI